MELALPCRQTCLWPHQVYWSDLSLAAKLRFQVTAAQLTCSSTVRWRLPAQRGGQHYDAASAGLTSATGRSHCTCLVCLCLRSTGERRTAAAAPGRLCSLQDSPQAVGSRPRADNRAGRTNSRFGQPCPLPWPSAQAWAAPRAWLHTKLALSPAKQDSWGTAAGNESPA